MGAVAPLHVAPGLFTLIAMPNYHEFTDTGPKLESAWRGIVLLGRNVQSYKFALGKSLLDLAQAGTTHASLEELAVPFTKHLLHHLKSADKQGTPQSSRFLNACREHLAGNMPYEELLDATVQLGFNNVLDAFHTVGSGQVAFDYFQVVGSGAKRSVTFTDDLFSVALGTQQANLMDELEARWRLVEVAWELGVETRTLAASISLDEENGLLAIEHPTRRISLSGARAAVGGYQKGTCFYCSREVGAPGTPAVQADVDHFIPWSLGATVFNNSVNLDGVWNLVVACRDCNRGKGGKMANLPSREMLQRLHDRNESYIFSHLPLREALIAQTGKLSHDRARFLNMVWQEARDYGLSTWEPQQLAEAAF